jgi:hypothetical protein
MLTYRRSNNLEVLGYSDSDYAGYIDTRKSTFGYVSLLASGAVSWKSSKQSIIATSTMEAEFVAYFESTIQALWLHNFVSRFSLVDHIKKPFTN